MTRSAITTWNFFKGIGCSPEREQATEVEGPIEYVTLERSHLPQVHDILTRAFWTGIDGMSPLCGSMSLLNNPLVSDSLDYSPERCTIVAMYKKMVVGVALLSSPQETYITYLAVKPGWDNAQIATLVFNALTNNPELS